MNDEQAFVPEEGEHTESKTKKRIAGAVGFIVTVALIAGALLVYLYRDELSSIGQQTAAIDAEAFTYENGSEQTFALVGDGLIMSSTSGFQLMSGDGTALAKEIRAMSSPAVDACSDAALVFDIGGEGCYHVGTDGTVTELEAGGSVITAAMGESGSFAVVTQESGYKGLITVYSSECQELFRWYSGVGYPLKVQLSPNGKRLAVLCAEEDGSTLHFFSLTESEEQGYVSFENELLVDMRYMSASRICLISTSCAYFTDEEGAVQGVYDFDDRYLCGYTLEGDGFAALYLSPYSTGNDGSIVTLDTDGVLLGSAEVGSLTQIAANGSRVLAAGGDYMTLYSDTLETLASHSGLVTAKSALLRSDGAVLLCYAYSADVYTFE